MADEYAPTPSGVPIPGANPPPPAGPPPAAPPVPTSAITAEPLAVPPIPLETKSKAKLPVPVIGKKDGEPKDSFRELIETVVFVVVLVLMLKTFLAEAFVIPTGSMATTLFGYHHKIACKECGYMNFVNASSEADPADGQRQDVITIRCENCNYWNQIRDVRPPHHGGGQ